MKQVPALDRSTIKALDAYDFQLGSVELQDVVEHALTRVGDNKQCLF